jgi:hypothetical protein
VETGYAVSVAPRQGQRLRLRAAACAVGVLLHAGPLPGVAAAAVGAPTAARAPGLAASAPAGARRVLSSSAVPVLLRPGAIELGLAGAVTSAAGITRTRTALGVGTFRAAGAGLASAELELGYAHLLAQDVFDAGASIAWTWPIGNPPLYPYVAAGGGLRQEWLGSFSAARYPVGAAMGLRVLAGPRADVRVEYRYRRVLHDPAADYDEHELWFGIGLLLHNAR